jgi:hypothetical protein
MALRAHVSNKYRTEPIDLQPYGNTISVEAPSDNPFESNADVEVYTQASGGMAGPDPRVRSRGLLTQRPRSTRHQGGKVKSYRVNMDAAHAGFMPGMNGLGDGPAPAPSGWDAFNALLKTGSDTTKSVFEAKTAKSAAAAADAHARAEASRADQQSALARMGSNAGQHPLLTYGLLAVAVAAVGYVIIKRK